MAYVTSPQDDEKAQQQDSSGPLVPGGAPSPSNAPSVGTAASQTPKTSGRFADLGEYLRVNAPQQFGGQLAGKVGSEIDSANNQLGQASNEFKSRADQNTITDTQGLTSQVGQNPENVDVNAFSKLRDAQYNGPTDFNTAQDLYNQTTGTANAAAGKAQASKTEGGRFALLDNYYGKPQYSQGQKTLDNLLVQNDPNSQQAFKQMQENAQALQNNVANTGQQLSAYGNQAKATTAATRTNARNAVGINDAGTLTGTGAIGDLTNADNQKLADKQAEADRIAPLAGDTQKIGQISPDLLAYLNSVGTTYGVKPTSPDYLSTIPKESLTNTNVASQQDLARMKALSQLAGVNDSYDVPDAGQYADSPLYSFNKDKYGADVGAQKQIFTGANQKLSDQKQTLQKSAASIADIIKQNGADKVIAYQGPDGQMIRGTAGDILKTIQSQTANVDSQLGQLYNQYGLNYATPIGGGVARIG